MPHASVCGAPWGQVRILGAPPPASGPGAGPGLGFTKALRSREQRRSQGSPPGTRPPCAAPGGALALSPEREPPAAGGLPRPLPAGGLPPLPAGGRAASCSPGLLFSGDEKWLQERRPATARAGRGRGGLPTPTAPRGARLGGRGTSASASPPPSRDPTARGGRPRPGAARSRPSGKALRPLPAQLGA